MKTDEIMQLPVEEIAADDAFLFIWAKFPNLPEAFRVMGLLGVGSMTGSIYEFCNDCEHIKKKRGGELDCPGRFSPYDEGCPKHTRFAELEKRKREYVTSTRGSTRLIGKL